MSRRRLPPRVELAIDWVDEELRGAGRVDEREVRVKAALPGEQVEARVLKRRRGVLYGEVTEVRGNQSPLRVTPPCPSFPRCGGCQAQHLAYDEQLLLKQRQVIDLLASNGLAPATLEPPVSGPRSGYRRKARLGVRAVGEQLFVGFRETMNSRVLDASVCTVLHPAIVAPLTDLRQVLTSLSVRAQVPQLEVLAGEERCCFTLRHLAPLERRDRAALMAFAARNQVEVLLQSAGPDSIERLVDGGKPAPLSYSLQRYGLNLQHPPDGFVQVNAAVNERLIDRVVVAVESAPGRTVTDLFCGAGNLSLPLARRGFSVLGIELSAAAISWAHRNAERNGLTAQCRFYAADLYRQGLSFGGSTWVFDPPRSGVGEQLAAWLQTPPERIVYVSCNPKTFASDARMLADKGFRMSTLTLFDMFPHTAHVEVIGVFDLG